MIYPIPEIELSEGRANLEKLCQLRDGLIEVKLEGISLGKIEISLQGKGSSSELFADIIEEFSERILQHLFIKKLRRDSYRIETWNWRDLLLADDDFDEEENKFLSLSYPSKKTVFSDEPMGVYLLNLDEFSPRLPDFTTAPHWRIFVSWKQVVFASFDVDHQGESIGLNTLKVLVVKQLGWRLLHPTSDYDEWEVKRKAIRVFQEYYGKGLLSSSPCFIPVQSDVLPPDISVSIVVATYDRPERLYHCLTHLVQQNSRRSVEIIIVDNHPESGLTPPIVAKFPGVILVKESRQGLSFARNAGILASTGDIIIATDDDVTVSPGWLEKLISPLVREDVMVVTGNVLPLSLTAFSQQLFEVYGDGGLGRGFTRWEANRKWFDSFRFQGVPTPLLGGTANAAFRASIFHHPGIGLLEEMLGAGSPAGAGEDIYTFYKVLKSGYTIVYEPMAWVWHEHRPEMSSLENQMYNYGKGIVAYHLLILLTQKDFRALRNLFLGLPWFDFRRIMGKLTGKIAHPLGLTFLEIKGHFLGPWGLWKSYQRVKKLGRVREKLSRQ